MKLNRKRANKSMEFLSERLLKLAAVCSKTHFKMLMVVEKDYFKIL